MLTRDCQHTLALADERGCRLRAEADAERLLRGAGARCPLLAVAQRLAALRDGQPVTRVPASQP